MIKYKCLYKFKNNLLKESILDPIFAFKYLKFRISEIL